MQRNDSGIKSLVLLVRKDVGIILNAPEKRRRSNPLHSKTRKAVKQLARGKTLTRNTRKSKAGKRKEQLAALGEGTGS